jgi:gluconokinase
MSYFLGVDIGTTSVKAIAFNRKGELICKHSVGYEMQHPRPDYSEQSADEILNAVILSINTIIKTLEPAKVSFISFSAMMHSLIAVNEKGEPLTNCLIWADNRASKVAQGLSNSDIGNSFYHSTGVPVHAMSPLCKLLWMKEHEPGLYNSAFKFIGIKEYVCYKFCGEYLVDTSIASSTGLLNLETLDWDKNVLDFLDLNASSLSNIVCPKHATKFNVIPEHAASLQIPQDTILVIGGSDGTLANLGTGSVESNTMAISIGTSGAARIVVNKVETDSRMRTFCYHLKDDLYVIGGASNNGAVVIEWLKDKLLETSESFPELFAKAQRIEPGSDDLLFLPYILGERAPVWNSDARGVFFGLNINHTKSHLVRACMEGVIYGMYSIAKILLEKRVITEIHATGGFAHSSLWVQMLADVCNIKVLVSDAVESSALGAVMIGMEAMDLKPFSAKEKSTSYEPDLLKHEIYMSSFEKFERIYKSIKSDFATREFISLLS